MKRILIAVFGLLILPGAIAAQTVYCYAHSETCPDDFPPDADVVIEGETISFRRTDILERVALGLYAANMDSVFRMNSRDCAV